MEEQASTSSEPRQQEADRRRMVSEVAPAIRDQPVLAAMARVPRHAFVPERLQSAAYDNRALPIGHQQTISQPLMVALTLQAAELQGHERVLEVGAGSGYQAALLAELASEVVAIELLPELVQGAGDALRHAGASDRVTLVQGDGTRGYPPRAPYDVIIVAAAGAEVPQALIDQLAEGGRLLIPLGDPFGQILTRLRKRHGQIEREALDRCAFVPLISPPAPE